MFSIYLVYSPFFSVYLSVIGNGHIEVPFDLKTIRKMTNLLTTSIIAKSRSVYIPRGDIHRNRIVF